MAPYGTAPARAPDAAPAAADADEAAPLLANARRRRRRRPLLARCRRRLGADVSRSWADAVLLLCYVVTGLLDSSSTQVWGAFVSMQTGACAPPVPRAHGRRR